MYKLRIIYNLSLVAVALLIVFTVFQPMAKGDKYSAVSRESLLEAKDEWILQFDIINHEGKETKYTLQVTLAGNQYGDQFLIQDGGVYTYIHHIRRDMVGTGEVSYSIYKEGEAAPVEQATYHLE